MNVVIHYPKTENGLKALQSEVAKIHAEAVTNYLKKMNCPIKQKIQLIREIQKSI